MKIAVADILIENAVLLMNIYNVFVSKKKKKKHQKKINNARMLIMILAL